MAGRTPAVGGGHRRRRVREQVAGAVDLAGHQGAQSRRGRAARELGLPRRGQVDAVKHPVLAHVADEVRELERLAQRAEGVAVGRRRAQQRGHDPAHRSRRAVHVAVELVRAWRSAPGRSRPASSACRPATRPAAGRGASRRRPAPRSPGGPSSRAAGQSPARPPTRPAPPGGRRDRSAAAARRRARRPRARTRRARARPGARRTAAGAWPSSTSGRGGGGCAGTARRTR